MGLQSSSITYNNIHMFMYACILDIYIYIYLYGSVFIWGSVYWGGLCNKYRVCTGAIRGYVGSRISMYPGSLGRVPITKCHYPGVYPEAP